MKIGREAILSDLKQKFSIWFGGFDVEYIQEQTLPLCAHCGKQITVGAYGEYEGKLRLYLQCSGMPAYMQLETRDDAFKVSRLIPIAWECPLEVTPDNVPTEDIDVDKFWKALKMS
jgi:hypothetical protein